MKELKRSEDVSKILKSSKPVFIFFYLDGCPHCEAMDPIWDELERETPSVEFVKAESAVVPAELGISGFPKFVKVKDGKQVGSADGEMSKDELKSKLLSGGRRRRRNRTRRLGGRRRKHTIYRSTRRQIPL
jgi:thiol-disulfide isomerase/thioredoxin